MFFTSPMTGRTADCSCTTSESTGWASASLPMATRSAGVERLSSLETARVGEARSRRGRARPARRVAASRNAGIEPYAQFARVML